MARVSSTGVDRRPGMLPRSKREHRDIWRSTQWRGSCQLVKLHLIFNSRLSSLSRSSIWSPFPWIRGVPPLSEQGRRSIRCKGDKWSNYSDTVPQPSTTVRLEANNPLSLRRTPASRHRTRYLLISLWHPVLKSSLARSLTRPRRMPFGYARTTWLSFPSAGALFISHRAMQNARLPILSRCSLWNIGSCRCSRLNRGSS
jgi:hypothetical protein